jgi:hypothetical protein
MRRLVTRVIVILGAAALAGCSFSFSTGGSDTLDPDKVEGQITDHVRERNPNMPLESVSCPDGVKPAKGVTFECTVNVDSVQWPFGVTITQVDVGEGSLKYNFKPTRALLIPEGIIKAIKAALRDQGVPNATVDCGTGRFRVVEFGGAIECTVSAGGERRVVRAVADPGGGVQFEEN